MLSPFQHVTLKGMVLIQYDDSACYCYQLFLTEHPLLLLFFARSSEVQSDIQVENHFFLLKILINYIHLLCSLHFKDSRIPDVFIICDRGVVLGFSLD